MGNDALQTNPTIGVPEHITVRGSDWLWAVFSIMAFTDLVVIVWHFTIPRGQRVFHQLAAIVLTTASIAYFSMASNLGYVGIATEWGLNSFPEGTLRQIWYARYIDWVITTPALLLTLVMASGLPLSDIITLIFFDLVMIVTGLIGALVYSRFKWGFFSFGTAALFYIWWVLAGPARTSAGALGKGYRSAFTKSAIMLSFLWLLYPIAWGLADGGNVITPDSEMIFYGILDVLAKPVFTLFHLYSLSKLDLTVLQLSSGKFTTSAAAHGHHHDIEKSGRVHPADNNTVGVHPHDANSTGAPAKKNFFGKKGKYDATTPANATPAAPIDGVNQPRMSEATVASR